jgi:alkylation response protein AidB-like acyl-CoA dehydrogenase
VTTLLYSEVEEDLRAAVRQAVTRAAGPSTAGSATGSVGSVTPGSVAPGSSVGSVGAVDLWRTLSVEIGCAGLAVPEDRGGAGGSWREVAVVAEELGRGVAALPPAGAPGGMAVPFLGSTLATAALLAIDPGDLPASDSPASDSPASDILAKVASGGLIAVLVLPLSTPPGAPLVDAVAVEDGLLTGRICGVADAGAADLLLVPTRDGLFAVEAGQAELVPVTALDQTRPLFDIVLHGAPATLVAGADAVGRTWEAALTAGAVILASEQLGVATWCLESTVDYVKTRYQFARPVGSFQAVKHRLAQLWVEVTQARAVARYAAGCLADGDPDVAVAASLAQAHCGPVAVRAAEEAVQLHGGIGFTWEHPTHWYLKRAKSSSIALGTAAQHRAVLATLVDLPPT